MKIIPSFIQRRLSDRPNLAKIVDNIGWLFFDRFLRMGVGLFVGIWIARYLGPDQFGKLNFAIAFVGLFSVLATLGLQQIVVRDLIREASQKEEILGTAALLLLFSGIFSYGLSNAVFFWLRPEDSLARILVAILGSTMLIKLSDIVSYWFESQVKSKYTVWVKNAAFLFFAAVKITLILKNASLVAFVWAMTAEAFVVAASMFLVLQWHGPKMSSLRPSFLRGTKMLMDSWPLLLSGITVMIYMKIDQIMLAEMVGEGAVGIYSAAVNISELWYFVPMAIVPSVFPAILAAKRSSEAEYHRRFQQLYDLMVWMAILVALPMTFVAENVVELLFGEAYVDAAPVLAVHIWAAIFVFLGVCSSKWIIAENRQILGLQRTLLGAVINVILNILLIPRLGMLGAAWATVIAQIFAALLFDATREETRFMFWMKLRAFNLFAVVSRYR